MEEREWPMVMERLRQNDPGFVELHLGAEMDDAKGVELAEVLRTNRTLRILDLVGATGTDNVELVSRILFSLGTEVCNITDTTALALAETLRINQSLISLALSSEEITEDGNEALARALEDNKSLAMIALGGPNISLRTVQALEHSLQKNTALNTMLLSSEGLTDEAGASIVRIVENSRLSALFLGAHQLTDETGLALARALSVNRTIDGFMIISDFFTDATCEAFQLALLQNPKIDAFLFLAGNATDSGVESLVRVMETNTSLRTMGIGAQCLTAQTGKVLGDVLVVNNVITTIALFTQDLTEVVLHSIPRVLQFNSTLTLFALFGDFISDECVALIAAGMKTNTSILQTTIVVKNLSDSATISLAEALACNKTLVNLALSSQIITNAAGEALAKVVASNKCLSQIVLSSPLFDDGTGLMFLSALEKNATLAELNVDETNISEEIKEKIALKLQPQARQDRAEALKATSLDGLSQRSEPSPLIPSANTLLRISPTLPILVQLLPSLRADFSAAKSLEAAFSELQEKLRNEKLGEHDPMLIEARDQARKALSDNLHQLLAQYNTVEIRALLGALPVIADTMVAVSPFLTEKALRPEFQTEANAFYLPALIDRFVMTMNGSWPESSIAREGFPADIFMMLLFRLDAICNPAPDFLQDIRHFCELSESLDKTLDVDARFAEIEANFTEARKRHRLAVRAVEDTEFGVGLEELESAKEHERQLREELQHATLAFEKGVGELFMYCEKQYPEKRKKLHEKLNVFTKYDSSFFVMRSLSMYSDLQPLSQGRHHIYKAVFEGKPCVLKEFVITSVENNNVKREVKNLKKLNHPRVISVQALFMDRGLAYIQFPFYEGGDLRNWLAQNKLIGIPQRMLIGSEVLDAISYIHSCGIIHCDIKPDNIFMTKEAHAILGDFDVSKEVEMRTTAVRTRLTTATTFAFTPAYAAPEILSGAKRASFASDMYSYGMLLIFVLFGREPSLGEEPASLIPKGFRKNGATLILSLLAKDPVARPTARQLLQHSFFLEMAPPVIRGDLQPPIYWEMMDMDSAKVLILDVTEEMRADVEALLNKTSKPEYHGQSRVEPGARPFNVFQVTKVERVENSTLWQLYANKRSVMMKQPRENRMVLLPEPAISEFFPPSSTVQLCEEVGETYLLHGTNRVVAGIIAHHGFAEAVSSLEGFWGGGMYFAENSSKSDEYVPAGSGQMILARVLLGRAHVQKEPLGVHHKLRRSACVEGHLDTRDGPCAHRRCDSLVADCKSDPWLSRYREFVVYQSSQAYPEYIIHYERV